ncbi:hypothetical protein LTR66_007328 [Elasticomyces elasticus]|nr:hypothetical protein LTR66_007328 [Elasticomyces elasticus]
MEPIKKILNWGHSTDEHDEKSGQEPVSGSTGAGTASEPYDTGNQQADSNLSGRSAQEVHGGSATAIGQNIESHGRGIASDSQSTPSYGQTTHTHGQDAQSLAQGTPSLAQGTQSLPQGTQSFAQGTHSHGQDTQSLAQGTQPLAQGTQPLAQGTQSLAQGTHSHGHETFAPGHSLAAHLSHDHEREHEHKGDLYLDYKSGILPPPSGGISTLSSTEGVSSTAPLSSRNITDTSGTQSVSGTRDGGSTGGVGSKVNAGAMGGADSTSGTDASIHRKAEGATEQLADASAKHEGPRHTTGDHPKGLSAEDFHVAHIKHAEHVNPGMGKGIDLESQISSSDKKLAQEARKRDEPSTGNDSPSTAPSWTANLPYKQSHVDALGGHGTGSDYTAGVSGRDESQSSMGYTGHGTDSTTTRDTSGLDARESSTAAPSSTQITPTDTYTSDNQFTRSRTAAPNTISIDDGELPSGPLDVGSHKTSSQSYERSERTESTYAQSQSSRFDPVASGDRKEADRVTTRDTHIDPTNNNNNSATTTNAITRTPTNTTTTSTPPTHNPITTNRSPPHTIGGPVDPRVDRPVSHRHKADTTSAGGMSAAAGYETEQKESLAEKVKAKLHLGH